jgi:hypothetical protein
MQKWEHRWEFVGLDNDNSYVIRAQKRSYNGSDAWDYLAKLGKDGWELVSVASQIGDINPQKGKKASAMASLLDVAIAGPRVTTMTQHKTGTAYYKEQVKISLDNIN